MFKVIIEYREPNETLTYERATQAAAEKLVRAECKWENTLRGFVYNEDMSECLYGQDGDFTTQAHLDAFAEGK